MPSRIYLTADTHFLSPGVLKFRPGFTSFEEHDEHLVEMWNSLVTKSDRVYHLGDVGAGRPEALRSLLSRLNGTLYLVTGNHDQTVVKPVCRDRFVWQKGVHHLKVGGQKMWLSHFPCLTWSGIWNGEFQLHGHCHDNLVENPLLRRMDVGVDTNGFKPWLYEEIHDVLSVRPVPKPSDLNWIVPL